MMARFFGIVLACAMTAFAVPALAASEPGNVTAQVEDAAKSCRDMGGKPNTEAMLSVNDYNGDGVEDWIVDYSKLDCAGAVNPFCGSGGCSLQIFLGSNGNGWKLSFDELVRSYRLERSGGHPMLRAEFGGTACGKVNSASCTKLYRLDRAAVVPTGK
jgi:hypothetical protein